MLHDIFNIYSISPVRVRHTNKQIEWIEWVNDSEKAIF